jgi:hypothetical protein
MRRRKRARMEEGRGDTGANGDEPDAEEVREREHALPLLVLPVHPTPGAPGVVPRPLHQQRSTCGVAHRPGQFGSYRPGDLHDGSGGRRSAGRWTRPSSQPADEKWGSWSLMTASGKVGCEAMWLLGPRLQEVAALTARRRGRLITRESEGTMTRCVWCGRGAYVGPGGSTSCVDLCDLSVAPCGHPSSRTSRLYYNASQI